MKNIKFKVLIIALIILMGLTSIVNAAITWDEHKNDREYVFYAKGEGYLVEEGSFVRALSLNNGLAEKQEGNIVWVTALAQPNVYCAQHGVGFPKGWWQASEKYTVEDPILEYILANGPAMGTLEENYEMEPSQLALWHYLDTKEADKYVDKGRILGTYTQNTKHADGTEHECCSAFKLENDLYKKAKEYANNLSNVAPTLQLDVNGNKLTITVKGSFEKFNLIINGVSTEKSKAKSATYTQNIDITNYNTDKITVKVEAKATRYTVKYYVLKRTNRDNSDTSGKGNYQIIDDGQRMIVVTKIEEDDVITGSVEKTYNRPDISLQKYIIKVTDKNNQVTYNNSNLRSCKYANTNLSNHYGKPIYKLDNKDWGVNDDSSTYKYDNALEINVGDTVTYRILVYNNGENTVKNINVKDTLPQGATITSIKVGRNITTLNKTGSYTIQIPELESFEESLQEYECDVTVRFDDYYAGILENKAEITSSDPKNSGNYRTVDADYVKMNEPKNIAVSLEKYIYSVTNANGEQTVTQGRDGKAEYLTLENGKYIDKTENDTAWTRHNTYKYDNVVSVKNGEYITYRIYVKNDGEVPLRITEIKDILPEGISMYKVGAYSSNEREYTSRPSNGIIYIDRTGATLLNPNDSTYVDITVKVSESNLSLRTLKNTAKITKIQDVDGVEMNADEYDTTPYNNEDSDYFGISNEDLIISGTVWNDKALDKIQDNYNGLYDEKQENKLEGIKVYLYNNSTQKYVETVTDKYGYYEFEIEKGPKVLNTNRWDGKYYSYYVVFEYDGITYTSTKYADFSSDNDKDSNARERLNDEEFIGKVDKTRTAFNDNFKVINNESGINYTTVNESKNIPQSIHEYNSSMIMQSSTTLIELSETEGLETQLKHINLGLRGRYIFDLALTTDVDNIEITVNGQKGVYKSNQVTLRQGDLTTQSTTTEDMANIEGEYSGTYLDTHELNIRNSDFNVDTSKYNDNQGISGIEVTYKITVHNESRTAGTANKIANYYDNKYTFVRAYSGDNDLSVKAGKSGTNYNSVVITTNSTMLNQSQTMEIYVVYKLNDPIKTTLEGLTKDNPLPTYNMAEITEYTTQCAEGQTEFTRGLLDKDSAPGSANKEQVRTTESGNGTTTLNGNPTTVEYYFNKTELSKLKYEDDTYAKPIIFQIIPDEEIGYARTITGKVYRDETVINPKTMIKTGNGKLDEGEVGVYGATVQLIEQVDGGKVRYTTTTGTDGSFEFKNFLPGNYIIRYYYGNTANTVLLNQNGNVNKYSFNGEDYQATNNKYAIDNMDTNVLKYYEIENEEQKPFWYVFNEQDKISTATDNTDRRNVVSANVVNVENGNSDKIMELLNNARSGSLTKDDLNQELPKGTLIDQTYMFADTQPMVFTVEKTELKDGKLKEREEIGEYVINNMNFGIAEVPVTILDLQKEVHGFTITDSTGKNILASASKNSEGKWNANVQGVVTALDGLDTVSIQIEDEKLQGAKLQVTYSIATDISIQLNFDNTAGAKVSIKELYDIIDNNLSYNSSLGNNRQYWELAETLTQSSITNISNYSTMVKSKQEAINKLNNRETITITLEKILSSTNASIEEIITSTVDMYEYNNIVEITELNYEITDTSEPRKDRIRTPEKYIIIPKVQHDTASAEAITIIPPTGDSNINIVYYVLAAISLVILGAGAFCIKKFVIKK